MKKVSVVTVAVLCISAPAFSYDFVLITPGISYPEQLQAAMLDQPNVDTFDLWNPEWGEPPLSYLEDYDGVMISSDEPWWDPVSMGNTLADYVDGGGVLIITTFCYGGIANCGIQGDIAEPPYSPFEPEDMDFTSGMWDLDIDDPDEPGHPILDGVNEVSCEYHNDNRPLTSCGHSVVKWNTGHNALAYNDNENVVGFTGYPGNYGTWMTGDGALMFRNAFVWMIGDTGIAPASLGRVKTSFR